MTDEDRKKFKYSSEKKNKTLEEEYLKMKSTLNIDKWENKRGPRPWEE